MPDVRRFHPGNFFVAHRHSYMIVESFMDHQLNGVNFYIFSTLGTLSFRTFSLVVG